MRVAGSIAALVRAPARTYSVVSWPGALVVSGCNVLYRDQDWEMGSRPPSCKQPFFFTHFFPFVPATARPQYIYIYIFMSLVEPNKFIKIYFIYFFSSFTHYKTLEKIYSIQFFFSSMLFTKHTIHTIHTQHLNTLQSSKCTMNA